MYYDKDDRKIKYRPSNKLEIREGFFTEGRRWYISVRGKSEYMHKDLTIQNHCGFKNMYTSKAEAELRLRQYHLKHNFEDPGFKEILDELDI
jgi:hypothetical protein